MVLKYSILYMKYSVKRRNRMALGVTDQKPSGRSSSTAAPLEVYIAYCILYFRGLLLYGRCKDVGLESGRKMVVDECRTYGG